MSLGEVVFILLLLMPLNPLYAGTVYAGSGEGPTCNYEIQGLDTLIKIDSTVDVGTSVFTLIIQNAVGGGLGVRRKRGVAHESVEHDILMLTNSSYYDLLFVDDHHEVVVTSCLQDGNEEPLKFYLNETLDTESSCGLWTLRTAVEPSVTLTCQNPNFTIPSLVNVSVATCLPGADLDVIELQFNNGGNCSSWNCSANCTNDAKLFWIEGRTLRTSLNNTSFNFTYEITVTCYDDEAPDKIESQEFDTAGDVIIDVIFTDTATCTSSTVTTMSNKPLVQSQESTGYFDKPENIAFVSSLGGATVLLAGIAVIYRPAKRYLCKTASVENVVS